MDLSLVTFTSPDSPYPLPIEEFFAAHGPQVMEQYGYILPPSPKEKNTGQEIKADNTLRTVYSRYDILRVDSMAELHVAYFRPARSNRSYRRLSPYIAKQLVANAYHSRYHIFPTEDHIAPIAESLPLHTPHHTANISNDIIEVAPATYWDANNVTFITPSLTSPTSPTTHPETPICMRVLFDADAPTVRLEDIDPEKLAEDFQRFYDHLYYCKAHNLSFRDTERSYHDAFWTWANGSEDVYQDLLKSIAACFMAEKPKGSFLLIGPTRNGKSSFITLLHTLFGRNNTSMVKLADFNNPGHNMELAHSFVNAPDEEDEGRDKDLLQSQGIFKSAASHGDVSLRVLYKQTPQVFHCDFMSFFPMNHFPEWGGSGAEACMRRSLTIPFTADLSSHDNTGRNFEKETYVPSFFQDLIPDVLALAAYCGENGFEMSATSKSFQDSVKEEVDSISTFIKIFHKHFDTYSTVNFVYNEYKQWCRENGYTMPDKAKRSLGQKLKMQSTETRTSLDGVMLRGYRFGLNDGNRHFRPDYRVDARTLEQWQTDNGEGESVINYLEGVDGE